MNPPYPFRYRPNSSRRAKSAGFACATTLLLVGALLSVASAPADTLQYELTPNPDTGGIAVEITWTVSGRSQSALTIAPQWGTARDVPSLLGDLHVSGATGRRTGKTRWLFEHNPNATIKCSYTVDPGRRELTWDAMHYPVTTRVLFHGMGNAFLLVPQEGGGMPEAHDVTLRWRLPDGWKAVCSWGSGTHVGARLAPADLRNSVYFAGKLATHTIKQNGEKVTVAFVDRFEFDAPEFATLAAKIVAQQCQFMGETDFPDFLVTAVPVGEPVKRGDTRIAGMGLHDSFALFAAPGSELTDAFEHLFAHELFHYWNGGILKAEKPDKLAYWFVEGFTDYYALRILFESGHWSAETYAKWINRHLREYAANPAKNATNQEIADKYWQQRDTVGEVPYQRGLMLGLRWHRLAREHGVKQGLDKLFFELVDRGRRGGFEASNQSIRSAGIRMLGDWFGDEFERYVSEAQTVSVPADALAPFLSGAEVAVYEFELGFDRARSLAARKVIGLEAGSAAAKAGLREGDALAGWKIPGDSDEKVELSIIRRDDIKTIRYYPRGKRSYVLQFKPAGR